MEKNLHRSAIHSFRETSSKPRANVRIRIRRRIIRVHVSETIIRAIVSITANIRPVPCNQPISKNYSKYIAPRDRFLKVTLLGNLSISRSLSKTNHTSREPVQTLKASLSGSVKFHFAKKMYFSCPSLPSMFAK